MYGAVAGGTRATTDLRELDDDEILLGLRSAWAREHLEEAWRRHAAAMLRCGYHLTRNWFEAQDLRSEAFLRTVDALRRGRGPRHHLRAYLLTAVRAVHLDSTRRRREVFLDDFGLEAEGPDAGTDPEDQRDYVLTTLAALPDRWQQVLWWSSVDGLRPYEIADRLGVTANAASALLYRARRAAREVYLQQRLEDEAFALEHEMTVRRAARSPGSGAAPVAQRRRPAASHEPADVPRPRPAS
jgi:RNA polymerase sigma factor (sigma-70 family)